MLPQGGNIVVDGVLASDQSEWLLDDVVPAAWVRHLPCLYVALQSPARWAYWVMGPARLQALDAAIGIQWVGHHLPLLTARLPAAVGSLLLLAAASRRVRRQVRAGAQLADP